MGLSTSCCSKDTSDERGAVDDVQRIEDEKKEENVDLASIQQAAATQSSVPSPCSNGEKTAATSSSAKDEAAEDEATPKLPAVVSAKTVESENIPGAFRNEYSLRELLRMGRFLEAEEQLKKGGEDPDKEQASAFLKKVMPEIRSIAPKARLPSEKDGWSVLDLSDIGMNIFLKRADTIDLCFSVDLPDTSWEMMLAMNWEADLSQQWLPFNPEVDTTWSDRASTLMMFVTAKVPILPGSREVYIMRHVVDCFTPSSVVDGRQGLLIVEKSPDNWATGGVFMDEFTVKPQSSSRWVTRDEQLESFTFYEYVNPTTIRCFIRYKLIFNVPSWLFPTSAMCWLAKFTGRRWHAGLMDALKKYEQYGYQARVDARKYPIYAAVLERSQKRSRMDLVGDKSN
eukprot:TRINITY_DN36956_c0_g1_i1.p1 TRINITY_DN36956_c0_g1~~TRINITY_DN36956_c0_g1_i1.p1  ORF type:complete len:398 (+),score=101.02 TRINITY_DN36956_c0_g1_i1:52-1245(+)